MRRASTRLQLARIELVEVFVAGEHVAQLRASRFPVPREQHPQVLHGGTRCGCRRSPRSAARRPSTARCRHGNRRAGGSRCTSPARSIRAAHAVERKRRRARPRFLEVGGNQTARERATRAARCRGFRCRAPGARESAALRRARGCGRRSGLSIRASGGPPAPARGRRAAGTPRSESLRAACSVRSPIASGATTGISASASSARERVLLHDLRVAPARRRDRTSRRAAAPPPSRPGRRGSRSCSSASSRPSGRRPTAASASSSDRRKPGVGADFMGVLGYVEREGGADHRKDDLRYSPARLTSPVQDFLVRHPAPCPC